MKKEAAQAAEAEKAEAPEDVIDIEAKPEITFDDFMKMQFQVGEIIACEEVKKSRTSSQAATVLVHLDNGFNNGLYNYIFDTD